jgi:hypothetical protein
MTFAGAQFSSQELAQLRELLERQQIIKAIYQYGRGIDRGDAALFKSVFWKDGIFDGGPANGRVWDTADDMFADVIANRFGTSQHMFGNILIQIDGDTAHSETYTIAYHKTYPTRESNETMIGVERLKQIGGATDISYDYTMGLRYADRWEKRDGVWKIANRRLLPDWTQVNPSSHRNEGGIMDHLKWRGARGLDDLSYEAQIQ